MKLQFAYDDDNRPTAEISIPAEWVMEVERLKGYKPSQKEFEEIFEDLILSRLEPEVLTELAGQQVGEGA
jgi:hypothetical protein